MGILDFFRGNRDKAEMQLAKWLDGTMPVFSQFGDNVYASDVVQQAIYCIVQEMKKLKPKHIRRSQFDSSPIYSDIQRCLEDPNPLMTRSDFLEKITWQICLNYNAFIYIQKQTTRDKKTGTKTTKVTGLYPLNPQSVTFLESGNRLYLQLYFGNGQDYILPYDSFIHLKTHYSVNDLMGGDMNGQPNNEALLKTVGLNHTLLEGVKKALGASFAINGIIKYNTMLNGDKMEAEIEEFEKKLKNSESGFLGTDFKSEIIPFKRDLKLVDADTLKFIDEKILRHFGVPLPILTGDYTTEQYEAFYQRTLEPLIVNYSEGFTKGLFTSREIGYRNEIMFYPKELVFMNTSQTLQMVHELGQSGTLFENEKREAFGLPPLEELNGVRLQSLNYVDVSIAKDYQLGLKKDNGADKKKDETEGEQNE